MKALTLNEIKTLVGKNNGPYLTVYTSITEGTDLKHNLDAAKEEAITLMLGQYSHYYIQDFINLDFKETLSKKFRGTLVLFRSVDTLNYALIPNEYISLTVVASSYHLKPFLEAIQAVPSYVLSLSPYAARLYNVDMLGKNMEWSIENRAALDIAWDNKGSVKLESKRQLIHKKVHGITSKIAFLMEVNQRVQNSIGQNDKLILNANKKDAVLYRCVNTHSNLTRYHIDREKYLRAKSDMHALTMQIVDKLVEEEKSLELGSILRLPKTTDMSQIISSIKYKTAKTLLISKDSFLWGYIDWENDKVILNQKQSDAHDDDILDDLAEKAVNNGITLRVLDSYEMPFRASAIAIKDGAEPMDSIISLPDLPLKSVEKLVNPTWEKIAV